MNRWSYHLPILDYHKVGAFRGDHVPTVSPEAFERQLAFLAAFHYRVLSFDELVGYLDRAEPFPRRSVAITFDDGYEETCTVAWPLLKRFGFPATVFIASGEVGWPGFVTWEQVGEMARDNITIGSHTMHHSYLPLVKEERLTEELAGSKQAIEAVIKRPVHYLSYPIGGFTPQAQAVVRQAGYRAACTTNRALIPVQLDRYALRRIKMTERDANPLCLLAKTSGYYDIFRQPKHPS